MSADASVARFEFPTFPYDADAAQKALNLWVGASSVFWAPFWAASTAGLSLWMVRESASRVAPFSDDLPPAFRDWLSARSLWFSGVSPVAEIVEDAAEAAFDIANDVPEVVLKVVDAAEDVVSSAIEVISDLSEEAIEANETVAETTADVIETAPEPVQATPVVEKLAVESPADETLAPVLKPTKEAAALAVSKTPVESVTQAPKTSAAKTLSKTTRKPKRRS